MRPRKTGVSDRRDHQGFDVKIAGSRVVLRLPTPSRPGKCLRRAKVRNVNRKVIMARRTAFPDRITRLAKNTNAEGGSQVQSTCEPETVASLSHTTAGNFTRRDQYKRLEAFPLQMETRERHELATIKTLDRCLNVDGALGSNRGPGEAGRSISRGQLTPETR